MGVQLKGQCLLLDIEGQESGSLVVFCFGFFHMKLETSREPQRLSERAAKNNPASVDGDKRMGQFRHAQLCEQMRLKRLD